MDFVIRKMIESDIDSITQTFLGWNKTREQYKLYWKENQDKKRVTLVAVSLHQVIGYTNVIWIPDYEPFKLNGIPEINDMNVIEKFQKQGVATALVKEAEDIALQAGKNIMGIAFGLTSDYGAAQRLYPKLGYIPDGRGAQPSPWGDIVYLTKYLK